MVISLTPKALSIPRPDLYLPPIFDLTHIFFFDCVPVMRVMNPNNRSD